MSRRGHCETCGQVRVLGYLCRSTCSTCFRRREGLVWRDGKLVLGKLTYEKGIATPERIEALSKRALAGVPLFPCYDG